MDWDGWAVWQKNGGVLFQCPKQGILPQGLLAPLFHATLMALAPAEALWPPAPTVEPQSLQTLQWPRTSLSPGLIQGIARDCQIHPKVQGLHMDWWTVLQQATQTTTVWGPGWTPWCPAIPICVPALYLQTNMVMPNTPLPYSMTVAGSFSSVWCKTVLSGNLGVQAQ
jgi:hypothetical protein